MCVGERMPKNFAIKKSDLKPLAVGFGACLASDRITVDGKLVAYMYREEGDHASDSSWRFFAGDESDAYCDDAANFAFYDINTIANYSPDITTYLEAPVGSSFHRDSATDKFLPDKIVPR
jgi:hypothetical protein